MIYTTLKSLVVSLMLLTGISSLSYADFYVIPINKKIKNVVIVAKSGGQFTDIKAAIASITDADATNPYVIYVGPGVYTITDSQIVMKDSVSIIGNGKEATIIQGSICDGSIVSDVSLLSGASNATLSNLSVKNNGDNSQLYCKGITVFNKSDFTISNVDINVSGSTNHVYGVFTNESEIVIEGLKVSTTDIAGSAIFKLEMNHNHNVIVKNSILQCPHPLNGYIKSLTSIVSGACTYYAICNYCTNMEAEQVDPTTCVAASAAPLLRKHYSISTGRD